MSTPPYKQIDRANISFRRKTVWEALGRAIELGLIKDENRSQFVERIACRTLREIAPKLRKAGQPVPPEIFERGVPPKGRK